VSVLVLLRGCVWYIVLFDHLCRGLYLLLILFLLFWM
jgi:hypothetical protein